MREYRLLWLGVMLLMGAMYMQMIARGYLVYELTGSARLVGLVVGAEATPSLSFGLVVGVVADRVERRRVIQVGQAAVSATAFIVAIAISAGAVTWVHLLVEALVQGVAMSFVWPARQAIVPQLVDRTRLSNVLALNSAASSSTSLVGPAIAGLLYAWVGPAGVFYIIGGMSLAAMALTGGISLTGARPTRAGTHVIGDITAGLTYVWRHRLLTVLLWVALATFLLVQPLIYLMPAFAGDIYDKGSEAYGLLTHISQISHIGAS